MVAEKNPPPEWYEQGVGQKFMEEEVDQMNKILPRLYGYHLVYMGEPHLSPLLASSLISHQVLIHTSDAAATSLGSLRGKAEALPILSDSVDVVVLAHTLEQAAYPHEVIREAHRILIPEGHLVITGFNPISLWGAWYAFQQGLGKIKHPGRMLGPHRVKDWLKLLNLQLVSEQMFYFRPPMVHEGFNHRLRFMEHCGQMIWPFWGGGYALLAVKRVIPLTPIRPRWRAASLWQGAPELVKPTTTTYKKNDD